MTARQKAVLVLAGLTFVYASDVRAQERDPSPPAAKWQIEVHGGGVFGAATPTGTGIGQFPVGASLIPGGGGRGGNSSTRAVSSWYFGDGTVVLNSALAAQGVGTRMASMDEALRRGIAGPRAAGVVGGRVSRRVTERLSAEVDVSYRPSALGVRAEAREAVAITAGSFVPAWNALLATGATTNRSVSSTVDIDEGTAAETVLSGGARFDLRPRAVLRPYVTAGAGVIMNAGRAPRAVLTGRYRFDFGGLFPMDETDLVTVRATTRTTPVVMIGGGAFIGTSSRRGLRVDLRVHTGPAGMDTEIDAAPTVAIGTSAFSIFTGGDPGVQFSNDPSATGRQSTLSGTTDRLQTFTGDGWLTRVQVSVGYLFGF